MGGSPDVPKMEKPKVVRMPTTEDPNSAEAKKRMRAKRANSTGRRSTMLSENLKEMTGSTGTSLGGGA